MPEVRPWQGRACALTQTDQMGPLQDTPVVPPPKKLHLIQAQVLFRHGARTPVHDLPGFCTDNGWTSMYSAVPLPSIAVRHARSLNDMGFPPSETLESTLRFGRAGAGPGTLTEKGARYMMQQVGRVRVGIERRALAAHPDAPFRSPLCRVLPFARRTGHCSGLAV